MITLTPELIEAALTPNGGITSAQLQAVGIPVKRNKGWKQQLIGKVLTEKQYAKFCEPVYVLGKLRNRIDLSSKPVEIKREITAPVETKREITVLPKVDPKPKFSSSSKRIKRLDIIKLPKKQLKLKRGDYDHYLKSNLWLSKSFDCKQRANFKCEICESNQNLQAHHYNYNFLYQEREKDLFCLCGNCHKEYHMKRKRLPSDNKKNRTFRLKHLHKVLKKSPCEEFTLRPI